MIVRTVMLGKHVHVLLAFSVPLAAGISEQAWPAKAGTGARSQVGPTQRIFLVEALVPFGGFHAEFSQPGTAGKDFVLVQSGQRRPIVCKLAAGEAKFGHPCNASMGFVCGSASGFKTIHWTSLAAQDMRW